MAGLAHVGTAFSSHIGEQFQEYGAHAMLFQFYQWTYYPSLAFSSLCPPPIVESLSDHTVSSAALLGP